MSMEEFDKEIMKNIWGEKMAEEMIATREVLNGLRTLAGKNNIYFDSDTTFKELRDAVSEKYPELCFPEEMYVKDSLPLIKIVLKREYGI
jgi:hypothetical protein